MATILIIDDRAINREFLSTLLSFYKHKIVEAADGLIALEIVKKVHPQLIISDILMPTMNGIEFVEKLKEDPQLAKIPVIFYTATYRLEEAKILGHNCGVKYVLSKPSEPEFILETVNKALGNISDGSEIKKSCNLLMENVPKLKEITNIGNRLENYIVDVKNITDTFNSFIKKNNILIGIKVH